MRAFSISTIVLMASVLAAGATLTTSALAQNEGHKEADKQGYVLKPGEGEKLGLNRIIKASPESGTQGGVMVLDHLPPGFTTGPHIHLNADEFFHVISGTGAATMGRETVAIGPGDVVFVPAGGEHEMSVGEEQEMELLYFLDKPGLDGFFRELHEQFISKSKSVSVADCNAIGAKYQMVCITQD